MKVLYATDGFPAAHAASRVITKLFRRDNTKVTVVSVTHGWSLNPEHLMVELDPIVERRGDSHKIVDFAATELKEAGFEASTLVLEGHPGHEIVKLAKDDFDVVVIGAGSHSWLGNRLLGSVSTFVLHEAPCSVLIKHESLRDDGIGRVVVGVDGSNTSDETVRMLSSTLDPVRCEIDVVSVVPSLVPAFTPVLMGPTLPNQDLMDRAEKEMVSQAEEAVRTAARELQEAGFKTQTRVLQGGPVSALLEHARAAQSDLVAVGSRGLGPVRRTFLGSVSDQVARHATAAFVGRFWVQS